MIDSLDVLNHPGVLKIARLLKDLEDIKQVRWHLVLRPETLENYDTNQVVCFRCMIELNEGNHNYSSTLVFVPEALYSANDETLFANTISKVSNTLSKYRETGDRSLLDNKLVNNPDS
jgi:hypothetical protein